MLGRASPFDMDGHMRRIKEAADLGVSVEAIEWVEAQRNKNDRGDKEKKRHAQLAMQFGSRLRDNPLTLPGIDKTWLDKQGAKTGREHPQPTPLANPSIREGLSEATPTALRDAAKLLIPNQDQKIGHLARNSPKTVAKLVIRPWATSLPESPMGHVGRGRYTERQQAMSHSAPEAEEEDKILGAWEAYAYAPRVALDAETRDDDIAASIAASSPVSSIAESVELSNPLPPRPRHGLVPALQLSGTNASSEASLRSKASSMPQQSTHQIPEPSSRPASAARSRPASAARARPASAARSRPVSTARSRPASTACSRPASTARSRPASAHSRVSEGPAAVSLHSRVGSTAAPQSTARSMASVSASHQQETRSHAMSDVSGLLQMGGGSMNIEVAGQELSTNRSKSTTISVKNQMEHQDTQCTARSTSRASSHTGFTIRSRSKLQPIITQGMQITGVSVVSEQVKPLPDPVTEASHRAPSIPTAGLNSLRQVPTERASSAARSARPISLASGRVLQESNPNKVVTLTAANLRKHTSSCGGSARSNSDVSHSLARYRALAAIGQQMGNNEN